MTIQLDPEGFKKRIEELTGKPIGDDIQLQINNLNEMLARMPNFTADDLTAIFNIIAKGFPQ